MRNKIAEALTIALIVGIGVFTVFTAKKNSDMIKIQKKQIQKLEQQLKNHETIINDQSDRLDNATRINNAQTKALRGIFNLGAE